MGDVGSNVCGISGWSTSFGGRYRDLISDGGRDVDGNGSRVSKRRRTVKRSCECNGHVVLCARRR